MAISVGVLSDTHGLLRDEVRSRLRGCSMIIHAGDVGSLSVLTELRRIAEVVVVRGNVDTGPWAKELKPTEYVAIGDALICVVHDLSTLELDPVAAGVNVIIYGHSHRPVIEHKGGILYLNPGSAGPPRFRLPIGMALLRIDAEGVVPELIEL